MQKSVELQPTFFKILLDYKTAFRKEKNAKSDIERDMFGFLLRKRILFWGAFIMVLREDIYDKFSINKKTMVWNGGMYFCK